MDEFEIIQHYFGKLTTPRSDVVTGIGDDCAVVQTNPGSHLVISTDTLVEGRHFLADSSPYALGYKSLAVNLSDIASMGAEPCWVSLALTLPDFDSSWLQQFTEGFASLARQYNLTLIGGDLTRGPLTISITIHGQVDKSAVLRRSGACPGDLLCVSGRLGGAALALQYLQAGRPLEQSLCNALEKPEPRVSLGQKLSSLANACIDISDGLASDLKHLCKASSVHADVNLEQIPFDEYILDSDMTKMDKYRLSLAGGDDYELCFAIAKDNLSELLSATPDELPVITVLGGFSQGEGISWMEHGNPVELKLQGFKHFT